MTPHMNNNTTYLPVHTTLGERRTRLGLENDEYGKIGTGKDEQEGVQVEISSRERYRNGLSLSHLIEEKHQPNHSTPYPLPSTMV